MVIYNCDFCKKEFKVKPYKLKSNHLFCSRRCYYAHRRKYPEEWQTTGQQVSCDNCGKKITKTKWQLKNSKNHFCSIDCKTEFQKDRIQVSCLYCGRKFERVRCQAERNSNNFCSNICSSKYYRGERSPTWRGGLSFGNYGTNFNDKLKEQVRKRDNYTCQECKHTEEQLGYKLNIHHIDYDKTNNSMSNLISLCNSCHSQSNYNRDDWTSYFIDKLASNYDNPNQLHLF